MSKIKVYVHSDGKLHFVNSGGADTALNFSSGPKAASGQLTTNTLDIMQSVSCGFKPTKVLLHNTNRYSTYIYDTRLSGNPMFCYINGLIRPISSSDYSELSFKTSSTGFSFMVKYTYAGDMWIWFAVE